MSDETKCTHCGQQMPPEPRALEPAHSPADEPRAGADSDAESVDGFCHAFSALAMKIPPSVRAKVTAKLERCGIDPAAETDDVRAVLEAACATYEKKREAARVSSAKRRAAKKAASATRKEVPAMD